MSERFRAIFKKEVYAYVDVEAESREAVESMESHLYEEAWESDSFAYPDSDWELSKIEEKGRRNRKNGR